MDMFYDEEFQEPNLPKDKKIGPTNPKGPYRYIEAEGFLIAATKWNLYY